MKIGQKRRLSMISAAGKFARLLGIFMLLLGVAHVFALGDGCSVKRSQSERKSESSRTCALEIS